MLLKSFHCYKQYARSQALEMPFSFSQICLPLLIAIMFLQSSLYTYNLYILYIHLLSLYPFPFIPAYTYTCCLSTPSLSFIHTTYTHAPAVSLPLPFHSCLYTYLYTCTCCLSTPSLSFIHTTYTHAPAVSLPLPFHSCLYTYLYTCTCCLSTPSLSFIHTTYTHAPAVSLPLPFHSCLYTYNLYTCTCCLSTPSLSLYRKWFLR